MKIEAVKKSQSEQIMGIKILSIWTGDTESSFTLYKGMKEGEEIISDVEVTIEETDTTIKENIKSKNSWYKISKNSGKI